uniref:flavodoxin n=1 Tax=Dysosmobacter welbionis TaxID=2093857 RepID=UPI003FF08E16
MSKILIAYFSASGVTARTAKEMAKAAGADLYEICPAEPYTAADLNWMDQKSRSTLEMNDPACRPAIAAPAADLDQYDTVFLGYPIWWQIAAWPVDNFVTANDFTGKTV